MHIAFDPAFQLRYSSVQTSPGHRGTDLPHGQPLLWPNGLAHVRQPPGTICPREQHTLMATKLLAEKSSLLVLPVQSSLTNVSHSLDFVHLFITCTRPEPVFENL